MRITRALPPLLLAAAMAACGASPPDDDLPRAYGVAPAADSAQAITLAAPANPMPADSAAADSACLPYEPETVTIRGRLERRMFYGPPNYGENPESDAPEPGFYLVPDAPVCTLAGRDEDAGNHPRQGIRLVQMVLDSAGYGRARPHLDARVRATGRLFGQHTGHHHAPVLLMADSIVPAGRPR